LNLKILNSTDRLT